MQEACGSVVHFLIDLFQIPTFAVKVRLSFERLQEKTLIFNLRESRVVSEPVQE